ncbi:hypothetical protein LY13_004096 [Prauserella aidingensis]|uniref:ABC transporter ATP-binding protein n=1 Tax=Prauserella aidingensis TaxID=387890 RepID=UPI0020A4342E|nr:ABC transporter ATP-binding protein [Prauserella aidingensis]MCP2255322.1 hypothetical protein [Prauserella aidingensis]
MQLIADRVGIEGPHGPLVPQTSLTVSSGELVIVKGEPGPGITAFGLALAGRLRPSTGTVALHDAAEPLPAEDGAGGGDRADSGDGAGGGDGRSASEDPPDGEPNAGEDRPTDEKSGGEEPAPLPDRPTADPVTAPRAVARRVAVVDSPGVSEPEDALPLRVVVGEELALAGRPADRAAVTRRLTDHDAAAYANSRFERLDADLRTRLLTALAASREGVRVLVLDRPDRHTSETGGWLRIAREHAERGLAVVVLTATAADAALPGDLVRVGRTDHALPESEARS